MNSVERRVLIALVLLICAGWSTTPLVTLALIALGLLIGMGDLLPMPARVRGLLRLVQARVFVYRLRRNRERVRA